MSGYPNPRVSRRAAIASCSTVAAVLAFAGTAAADSPTVSKLDGNPKCSDVASGLHSVKIDPVRQGATSFGNSTFGGQIDVSGRTFDWSSNSAIDVVIVKGG